MSTATTSAALFLDGSADYLKHAHSTDEKARIAEHIITNVLGKMDLSGEHFSLLDMGTGNGAISCDLVAYIHHRSPGTAIHVLGQEINSRSALDAVQNYTGLFVEHEQLVMTLTNLPPKWAASLAFPADRPEEPIHHKVVLHGKTSYDVGRELRNLTDFFANYWGTKLDENDRPVAERFVALTICRDGAGPTPTSPISYKHNLAIASQPWRLDRSDAFKGKVILTPLLQSVAPGGNVVVVEAERGSGFAHEVTSRLSLTFPPSDPQAIFCAAQQELCSRDNRFNDIRFGLHTEQMSYGTHPMLTTRPGSFAVPLDTAAWDATVYVQQIPGEKVQQIDPQHVRGAVYEALQQANDRPEFVNRVLVFHHRS